MNSNTEKFTEKLFDTDQVFDSLAETLATISDQRQARGLRYELKPLLLLLCLSKFSGADKPSEIADWIAFRFDYLKEKLLLPWKRSPHHSTWRRLLDSAIEVSELEKVIGKYLQKLSAGESQLLNLDGKCVRGTVAAETGKQLHLLSLQESSKNLVIEQSAVQTGENEISGAKRLLTKVSLKGQTVSGDAIFAQQEISSQIVGKGGEYLWKLRGNQERMYEEAKAYFAAVEEIGELPRDVSKARSIDKGHGRIEEREILTSWRLANLWEFPHVEQVFQIRRQAEQIKTGKRTEDVIYGITSLPGSESGATELLELIRKHWSIENGLHYRRDVTFKEDSCRQQSHQAGQVLAILNNLVIGLLRKIGWENIAQARRYYNAQVETALLLIMNPIFL